MSSVAAPRRDQPRMRAGTHSLKRGFVWLGSASAVARLVDLAALALVVALVTPAQIGAAAVAWTAVSMLEPLASLGLAQGLLTVRRVDRLSLHTALWIALFGGVSAALCLTQLAPLLAAWLDQPALAPLVSVAALKLIPASLAALPQQRLARALRQREIAAASVLATLGSALVRVGLALFGAGAWAFVLAQVAYSALLLAALWLRAPLRVRLRVDEARARALLRAGLPSTFGLALGQWARNVDYLFVGGFLGLVPLGLYRVAFDLAMEPLTATGDVVARSATPTLQKLAHAPEALGASFRYAQRLTLAVALPLSALVLAFAPELLGALEDPSYRSASDATRLLVVAGVLRVMVGLYTPLAMALGKPELALRLGVAQLVLISAALALALVFLGPTLSITAAGLAWCVAMVLVLGLAHLQFRGLLRRAGAAATQGDELPGEQARATV